ncbi:MAG: arylesterase, partial [Proteobacteria bacterium]|nr:arylesterase [Pseudomonadota bacterium]
MKRILIFGDSNGWGYTDNDDGYRFKERWPISLKSFLSEIELNVEIIEDCLPGRTTNVDDAQEG